MDTLLGKIGMNTDFWKNKRVLVTGHTGFKGGWLSLWLSMMGAKVYGFSRPPTEISMFYHANKMASCMHDEIFADITDREKLGGLIDLVKPEIIFHLAAQSLVSKGFSEPIDTFESNISGVITIFDILRSYKSKIVLINVTSDKCYENLGNGKPYREGDRLGGNDPYSVSKACSELISTCYRKSFFAGSNVQIATARAGNVIGGGDYSDDRLLPDLLRAFENNGTIKLRNPNSTRPWQHVLEPLSGYLTVAERMWTQPNKFDTSWNFGPEDADVSVYQIVQMFQTISGELSVDYTKDERLIETNLLALDTTNARERLDWRPKFDTHTAVKMTIDWHRANGLDMNMLDYSKEQIKVYAEYV